ncbi:MAG: RlmE family RNA methyltransferase [Desulfobulbaceae bacterium]|nr:MAG: RlmE family RNA methyltransferase [Desulfobulbaceae bacterium]
MKKVQDYYYKKAKKQNYPARSVYKLEEIQKKHRIISRGDSVLDLGCSPGSWSLYASEIVGEKGVVVGVDLKKTEAEPRGGGSPIHWLCHDVTDPDMVTLLRKIRSGFKVLISDMAPKTTGNRWADHQQSMRLVEHSLTLAHQLLHQKGNYLCKLFQGEDMPEFISRMKQNFEQVKVIKPDSSRKESREVFILGVGFKHSQKRQSAAQ